MSNGYFNNDYDMPEDLDESYSEQHYSVTGSL